MATAPGGAAARAASDLAAAAVQRAPSLKEHGGGEAAEDIARPDHQAQLMAGILGCCHLARDPCDRVRVDAEGVGAHQGFPGKLEQDATKARA